MPDFDQNLNPVLLNTNQELPSLDNPATPVPQISRPGVNGLSGGRGEDPIFGSGPIKSSMLPTVSAGELYANRRYGTYSSGVLDLEDQKANAQSNWDKAANGILKGVNLAATTVAGSFGMLYGVGKWATGGKFSDIYSNDMMKGLDEWNNEVDQTYLPNYYTNIEKDSAWYSTDNWFTANFLFDKLIKNSGFAVGAMVSGNIANAGLLRAGSLIGRGLAAGAESAEAFKLFSPLLRNTARAFSNAKNIEAAAILEKEISSIADLTARTSKLGELAAQTSRFAEIGDVGRQLAVSAYSAAGEASFEALQTATSFRNDLIEQYKIDHGGAEPTGAELDKIDAMSSKVGNTSFLGNMALLGATEFQQLPYLLGSTYKNTRNAANRLIGATEEVALEGGKYVAKAATSKFGKLYNKVTGVGRYFFDPKEAAQEVGQYALQVGTQNYFTKGMQGDEASVWTDAFLYGFIGRDEEGKGVGAFTSKEGMESLLLGGITGGLMQAKGMYQESASKKSNTEELLRVLNTTPSFKDALKDKLANVNRGVVLQQQEQDAVINGDELEAKDLRSDMMHNYLASRIKYGKFDMMKEDMAELKRTAMTNAGLSSLKEQGLANINDTPDQYIQRINTIEKTGEYINNLYDSFNLRYSGEINKDGSRKYSPLVIDKMVYAASKVANYDLRIPQLNTPLADNGVDTATILTDIIKNNKPSEEATANAIAQISGLDVNSEVKDDLKIKLQDVIELSLRRKSFLEEFDDIKANPQKYDDALTETPAAEVGETQEVVKVKTKAGEQDIEIGTEYFLGKVVEYDKNGKEVYRFPKLTILGENEDGTIKIKDSNGNVKDVTKDVLLDYKLSKVSRTLSNKKAKFFMDNANNIFEFNFGKKTVVVDGKKTTVPNKVKGRLEYSDKDGVLNFVYKDKSGKIKSIEVTGDQFVAKQGYDQAMIVPVGTLTAVQKKSLEEYTSEQDARIESKRKARLKILTGLFDEVATKLDETTDLITKKRDELNKVNDELVKVEEQIKSGDLTKKNTFKSATNKAIKAANKLSRLREDLRLEIEALEAQKEELEFNLAYVSDMAQNIDKLPTDSKEFLEELKEQVSYLEDMTLETGKNINSLSKLIDNVDKALKDAVEYALNLIEKFEKKYPGMPIAPEGLRQFLNRDLEFKGAWPDYQSYIQANPNLMKDLMEFDRELADIDELDVTPNERTLGELREAMTGLQNTLSEISQELGAKELILNRFQEAANRYKKELAEEEKMKNDAELQKAVLGTLTNDQQTIQSSETYEADRKKADRVVVSATVSSGGEIANRFGANFGKLKNKDNIRGVYVTEKNEVELGLEGFTQRIVDEADPTAPPVDKSKIIALVMVEQDPENTENFWLVDENGEAISQEPTTQELTLEAMGQPVAEVNPLDSVIYQVFPLEDLEWDDKWSKTPGKKVSMFRKSTPKEVVDALKAQYKDWRNNTLENPTLTRHTVEPSFGIPQYVTTKDQNGNNVRVKDAAVAVEDSELITSDDLRTRQVILVPTVEKSIEKGSTVYNDPKGLPFLETEAGYVKLQNRKLTENEVNTIYQAVKTLADIVYKDGNLQSTEAKRVINWLKSVVYWGTPKDAPGYNSIWFDRVDVDGVFSEPRLFLSGKGESISFTPSSIRESESKLKTILSGMYNNVNATMVKGGQKIEWNEPYEEIVSISDSGEVTSRTWKNYQSFLLSKVDPDGKQRDAKQIPLTTQIKPITVPGEMNREGIYFTVPETAQSFTIPEIKATKKASVLKPGAPAAAKPAEAPTTTAKVEYDLTGKKKNTYTSKSGFKILFMADGEKLLQNDPKGLVVLKEGDVKEALQAIIDTGATQEDAQKIIRGNIIKDLTPALSELQAQKAQSELEVTVGDVEEAVSDLAEDDVTPEQMKLFSKQATSAPNRTALRVRLKQELEQFEGEDWNKVQDWLKANFPNIPVYRVKNILQNTNGVQAWGMLQDGAIYIYENAEVGTIYHEVFEAVWKMFTDNAEQTAIINEFKNRKGTFVDRPTGETVKYSEATRQQIKEQLAEEFRDYVKDGKVPPKPADGRPFIVKLFSDLVNFIKSFFTGKSAKNNTEKLFEKIGTGYYKTYSPYHSKLAFAKTGLIDIEDAIISDDAEFRLRNMRGENIGDIIQHMTYVTLRKLIETNQGLFQALNLNKKEIYPMLKEEVMSAIAQKAGAAQDALANGEISEEQANRKVKEALTLWKSVDNQWDEITKKHEEQLKSYSIEFDENDNVQLRDQDASKKYDWQDATKIDNFKKANGAIKLLLSTIPITRRLSDGTLETIPSSINGVKLMPATEVYMAILNRTHSALNIDEMMEIIRQMALEDANYQALYTRLTKNKNVNVKANLTTSLTDMHDVRLLTAFWKSFKKQNPDVKNVYILDNGDVSVGDSNFTTATNQLREEYINSIKDIIKNKNPYFEYDAEKKVYVGKRGALSGYQATAEGRVKFLKTLGIEFDVNDVKLSLSRKDLKQFNTAVDGIAESINKAEQIATVGYKFLKMSGRLRELAEVQAKLDNPEFSSTYFNVNGERTQTFIGTNAASDLYDVLIGIDNLSQLAGTQYEYLTTDTFAKNSVILGKMFDLETGKKIEGAEKFLKTAYADGMVNMQTGKKKESSKLSYRDRLVQEINMNLNGYYLNLVPGDASLEWMMYMGNPISEKSLTSGLTDTFNIFKGYLIDEINLARDTTRIVAKKRNAKELRFMKAILGEDLQNKILKDKRSAEQIVNDPSIQKAVNSAIEKFINDETAKFRQTLENYRIIERSVDDNGNLMEGYDLNNLGFEKTTNVGSEDINMDLKRLTINYMINNIELHKVLYSDPYQYSDELKRIKNFLSPRQAIMSGSSAFNSAMNKTYNKGFEEGSIGYTDFDKDYFKTVALNDIQGLSDLPGYGTWDETDGAGMITMQAYRNFRLRAGEWNDKEEEQYKYDIEFEQLAKSGADAKTLKEFSKKNPSVNSAYTPLKPIVSGNKADGNNYNDVILDKFALYPLSFRVLHQMNPESNAIKLYNKMRGEKIDYAVYNTARKVGARKSYDVYDAEGNFMTAKFDDAGITNVPFAIMSVQAEVPSKEDNQVTRGSQVTKLITMDYMAAGVPVDFMEDEKDFNKRLATWYNLPEEEKLSYNKGKNIYKEIKNNQDLLEEMMRVGYQRLLKQFGIKEVIENGERAFKIADFKKVADTLREEMLKREINDNISEALTGFENGDVVLEATPAYQQVKNILYSIADREVISPKINGGQKVQLPSSLLESVRANRTEINGKEGYASDHLKFYVNKDGERVCEIMVARWFDSPLSDDELLNYFNNTEEGKKQLAALSGVAFRIPTQKQNSIDAFVINKFLPKEYGDSVIIPSELVKKAGSDFDIDKLFIYLKNVYQDGRGNTKLIPYFGIGEEARKKFAEMFDKGEFLTEAQTQELDRIIEEENSKLGDDASSRLMQSILGTAFDESVTKDYVEALVKNKPEFREAFIDGLYKKSLENQYIQSGQDLVSHPKNFDRLISPNSAQQMKDLSGKIVEKLGMTQFDYKAAGNMLSRDFMTRLRHSFVSGKYAIGIAAVNQTNHSLSQRSTIVIDPDMLAYLSKQDVKWLKDASIKFKSYNQIQIGDKTYATLSMIKNAEGQDISDIIGQFIDGYVDISKGPWIMELGATPNVAGTWLFLAKIGVPIETVAYFMNQPIIRDFLREIENSGSTWLFNEELVDAMKTSMQYRVTEGQLAKVSEIPGNTALFQMIGNQKLTPEQRAQQQFILDEFLKYSKMANHLLKVTQGTNFDTASFNDPFLVYKKMRQLQNAQKSIISSANQLLGSSFVGDLATTINKIRNAYATILKSDSGKMRILVETILDKYVDLSDRDFIKISQKVVSDIFDWAVQNDREINMLIEDTLLSDTKNAAKEMATFINGVRKNPSHPLYNNQVVKLFNPKFSDKKNGVNNIQIKNKDNKAYDQNQLIYAFDELKSYLKVLGKPQLYDKLVRASVLQSGLSNSPIAFTNLLPYSDFKEMYNQTLAKLEKNSKFALNDFLKLNVFERNNWSNDDIVPTRKAQWRKDSKGKNRYNTNMYFGRNKELVAAMNKGAIPKLLKLSTLAREANSDVFVYSWEEGTKKEKEAKKKIGDYSYIKKGLFKKVLDNYGDPLTEDYVINGEVRQSFIYKPINAWGDSFRANEFYTIGRKSVIDNRFMQVDEIADQAIVPFFAKKIEKDETDETPGQPNQIAPEGLPPINDNNQNSCG
jgi:hypothetical protein